MPVASRTYLTVPPHTNKEGGISHNESQFEGHPNMDSWSRRGRARSSGLRRQGAESGPLIYFPWQRSESLISGRGGASHASSTMPVCPLACQFAHARSSLQVAHARSSNSGQARSSNSSGSGMYASPPSELEEELLLLPAGAGGGGGEGRGGW